MYRSIGPWSYLATAPVAYTFLFNRSNAFYGTTVSGYVARPARSESDVASYELVRHNAGCTILFWIGVAVTALCAWNGPGSLAVLCLCALVFIGTVTVANALQITRPGGPYEQVAAILLGSP